MSRVKAVMEARAQLQEKAEKMGINDEFISILVDRFYEKIKIHPEIGPVFEHAITDDWDHHLSRMKDFWASVALNAGRYSGQPVPKHQKLVKSVPAAQAHHFVIWLSLFRETLDEIAPSKAVTGYFMERAERIAKSLELAMFGVPGLGAPH